VDYKEYKLNKVVMTGVLVFCGAFTAFGQYWTGSGGKGMSIAVLTPEGRGLSAGQNYLPTMVQGVFVGDFATYSAIQVLDRQALEKTLRETESGIYAEGGDVLKLGEITQTGYIMTGSITKTGSGYAMQIQVADATRKGGGATKASYSGNCTIAELDNFSGIRRASMELLEQLGVKLTAAAKTKLSGAGAAEYVQAETALARGIVAQRSGTVVEALSYYYQAASFDPSLMEAAGRTQALSASVQNGNLGEAVRNDIQLRSEWIKVLDEARAYFKAHPPYQIIYDPRLAQGKIDYTRETVDINFDVYLHWTRAGYQVYSDLMTGLGKTGKAEAWGLTESPLSGLPDDFTFSAALVNEEGKTLGAVHDILSRYGNRPLGSRTSVSFKDVNANEISGKLTVSITTVNGMDAETAGEQGYISISAGDYSGIEFSSGRSGGYSASYKIKHTDFKLSFERGLAILHSYNLPVEELVVPGTIGSLPVGVYFYQSGRPPKEITFLDGVVEIDIALASSAYHAYAKYTTFSFSLPANVTWVVTDYDSGRTFPIMAGVTDQAFAGFYNRNGKKAGMYTFKKEKWSYSPKR
jgi:TolB-like protein